jgi:OHCU decarboxylase
MRPPVAIATLNAASRRDFVGLLAGIYERSPWVAEQAWSARPFADRRALEGALAEVVRQAPRAEQLALLRRHPRLGSPARLSERSRAEQRGAGLPDLPAAERDALMALNDAYERRFGFPFIVAVKNLGARDIIASARARLENDPAAEFAESLEQVFRIAAFRLAAAVGDETRS